MKIKISDYKVTFIIPFLGNQFPQYLPFFLNSCKYNTSYRFLLFTNLVIDFPVSSNVEIIKFNKEKFERLIFSNTGIKANLKRFYKICDFKPAFGEIFRDYIDTPFWGHTDIDLIYGNLDKFLGSILNNYDLFSFRAEYHTGSFAIYRNLPEVNSFYRKINTYEETLLHPTHFAFDEVSRFKSRKGNIYNYLLEGGSIYDVDTEVESFTHLMQDRVRTDNLRIYAKTLIKEKIEHDEVVKFNCGSIIVSKESGNNSEKEYLLYHSVIEKALNSFEYPDWKTIPGEYFITRWGFHKRKNLIPVEVPFRFLKLFFTMYPIKIIEKLKQIFYGRYPVNETTA